MQHTDDRQASLGIEAHARRSDPATSKQAAASLTMAKMRASHLRVLQLFRLYGDMDDRTLRRVATAEGWTISDSGLRTRRSELAKPNMDRLDEIAEELAATATGNHGLAFADLADGDRRRVRERLKAEGFRSPLWDTGRRETYEQGREGVVWGLAV